MTLVPRRAGSVEARSNHFNSGASVAGPIRTGPKARSVRTLLVLACCCAVMIQSCSRSPEPPADTPGLGVGVDIEENIDWTDVVASPQFVWSGDASLVHLAITPHRHAGGPLVQIRLVAYWAGQQPMTATDVRLSSDPKGIEIIGPYGVFGARPQDGMLWGDVLVKEDLVLTGEELLY